MTAAEFTILVQKHQGLVYTVCRQLTGDDHIAQDLAQETFLSAFSQPRRTQLPNQFCKNALVR